MGSANCGFTGGASGPAMFRRTTPFSPIALPGHRRHSGQMNGIRKDASSPMLRFRGMPTFMKSVNL